MIHWCPEETAAVLALIPGFLFFRAWVRGKWAAFQERRARKEK